MSMRNKVNLYDGFCLSFFLVEIILTMMTFSGPEQQESSSVTERAIPPWRTESFRTGTHGVPTTVCLQKF